MKLKWRNFKGLYTNIDASDKGVEYFSKFKDIKVYPGYIESKGLSFEEESYGIPEGHTFVRQQYVFLDEDKYQNTVNGTIISPELKFVLNTGYRTDISFRGTPTTTEAHSYKIRIDGVIDPPNLPDKCFTFRWSKDNGEESEAITVNDGEDNYTVLWYSLTDGLEVKFDEYMYSPIPADKVWLIRSDWTNPVVINEDPLELTNTYIQDIQKYLFQISYYQGSYYFYVNSKLVNNTPFADHPGQYPKIINEQGTLKVLMKKQALWVGKVNRSYWIKQNSNIRIATIPEGFYAYPLAEALSDELTKLFDFSVIAEGSLSVEQEVTPNIFSTSYNMEYQGLTYEVAAIKFEDEYGVVFYPDKGYLPLWKVKAPDNTILYAMWSGHVPRYITTILQQTGVSSLGEAQVKLVGDNNWINNPFGSELFIGMTAEMLTANFGGSNKVTLNMVNIGFGSDFGFSDGDNLEIVTTILTATGEYPIHYQKIDDTTGNFIIKIDWKPDKIRDYYKNKITANVYFRYNKDATADESTADYELCYTAVFTTGVDESSYTYINKLTPNGIMLTQMIGKFFNASTYKIITAFDDYVNVAGVPYILKNSNVHYPAVGGGAILNNFYYENVVPGIEGERLIAFTNLLGVFSGTRELMTLIDFSPVESSMIFYIKDTLEYKVKDEKDLIETPEGTFIHLKEGVYITNGRERTLISEPINDIVKRYYSSSNIFYNSYHKQLFYIVMNSKVSALYCFDFETQSWSEYSLPRNYDSKNPIIDFIEDYEGNIYFITKAEPYKLSYIAKSGELELSYIDLQEYSISKRINYLAADHAGTIEAVGIAKNENNNPRGIRYLFNRLANRKPIKDIVVGIKFNGSLYGVEMDIETMRTEQL